MYKSEDIDFSRITDWQFEYICFELIQRNGYENVVWRKKGPDSGRDIEAELRISNPLMDTFYEKWFFECKHYKRGVPPEVLNSKIAWADAEKPDHLVIMLSSHMTNPARTWLKGIRIGKPYKIHIVEGDKIKKVLEKTPILLFMYFANGGIGQLLHETKKNWLSFNFYPTYDALRLMIAKSNLSNLVKEDLAFLTSIYFLNLSDYDVLNDFRDRDKDDLHTEIIKLLINHASKGELLYNPDTGPWLGRTEGITNNLDGDYEIFYISGEAEFYDRMPGPFRGFEEWKEKPKLEKDKNNREAIYTFLKVDDNKYLEVVSYKDSSFECEINLVESMTNWDLMFLLWSLGFSKEFATEVFNKEFINLRKLE